MFFGLKITQKKVKTIQNSIDLRGKIVFLRCDFNVPIINNKIIDDYKIIASLPMLRYLLRYKCKIIVATHLEQKDNNKNKISTKPISLYLSKLLNKKIKFSKEIIGKKIKNDIKKLKDGNIIFLENLRFEKGEKSNSQFFAKKLASLADIYINNAFAVCHRSHASVDNITKYIPSYAGFLVKDEIINLNKIIKPKKPFIAVMGGAKVGTKVKLLNRLLKKADKILIGGQLANNFLSAKGFNIGSSKIDKESLNYAKKIKSNKIILPIDYIVAPSASIKGKPKLKNNNNINEKDMILDIGPETIKMFAEYIKKAKTIIWNGPLGMFEIKNFRNGTVSIARLIASRSRGSAFGVVGGGETIEALKMTGMIHYVDWVSTGGGAMLSYLGGENMPGLKKIYN